QEAKVRADRERKVIAAIGALARYATSSGAPSSLTIAPLREKLADEHNRLDALLLEQDQHRSAETALGEQGLDLENYGGTMEAASSLLGPGKDPFDDAELNCAIKAWEDK